MSVAKSSPYLSKIIIVAALGYFVDIYDLVLFGMERVSSLTDILSKTISDEAELKRQVKEVGILLLNLNLM